MKILVSALILPLFNLLLFMTPITVSAISVEEQAYQLTTLYRVARKVMSDNQHMINDRNIGFKGVTAKSILQQTLEVYELETGTSLEYSSLTPAEKLLVDAIEAVIDDNQQLINEKGIGFKGFLPAIFAGQVAEKFNKSTQGKMKIKLTAPSSYVRNIRNSPDSWEERIIEEFFRANRLPKGKPYAESSEVAGKKAYRFMLPEYYEASCLGCHGMPKGTIDMTGHAREGGELYGLGGAISLVIYDDETQ